MLDSEHDITELLAQWSAGDLDALDQLTPMVLEELRRLTQFGQPMTPSYASPEQIQNGPITTASDVYSLGRLLYELLTGRHPYGAVPPGASLSQRILEREPEPPSRAPGCRHLAGDLDSIVLEALEKDPRRRYSSVEQLSEDLGRHLEGLPVRARQSTAPYLLGKFFRRHRLGVSVAAAALAGILAVAVSMTVLRGQAVRERRRAEEVTRFLIEVFQNPDPEVPKGEDVTARQLLDTYAGSIGKELEPEDRAAVMDAMGQAYLGLALYDQAEPLLEESLRLRRESPRTRPEQLAETLFNLAAVRRAEDRDGDAAKMVREALEILRRAADDPLLARALNNQAVLFKQRGDVRKAEELYRESLELKVRLFGEEHADVATGKNNLAAVLRLQGKYDEAEELYRESLELKIELYGRVSKNVATTLNNLALVLLDRDNPDAAEPLLREALEIRRAIYDAEHPVVGNSLVNLGFVLRLREDYEEAEARYGEAMRIFIRMGEDHSSVANVLRHQASLLLAQGRPGEAEDAARRALEIFRRTKPEGYWRIAVTESVLGSCLLALGRDEEAAPLLRRGYETLRAVKGDEAHQTREALERLEQLAPENR